MAIKIGNKILNNLEEQVLANAQSIQDFKDAKQTLVDFGISVIGILSSSLFLPASGENYGDAYLIGSEAPYDIQVWTRDVENATAKWVDLGQFPLAGPQGIQGPKGASVYVGSLATLDLTQAVNGDIVIDTTTGILYRYEENISPTGLPTFQWVQKGSIKGPRGEKGSQGPQGIQGPQGETGPQGPKGDTGPAFNIRGQLSSTAALPSPTAEGQSNGDAYIIPVGDENHIYVIQGPTASGDYVWTDIGPSGVQGPQGETGPQGPQGETGPQGPQGETGPQGPQGKDGANAIPSINQGTGANAEVFNGNPAENASGYSSHAEGYGTKSLGIASHTEGDRTTANSIASHAEGDRTTASGTASHAEGSLTVASSFACHAEGDQTTASENACHAEGYGTKAVGVASHAEGMYNDYSNMYGDIDSTDPVVKHCVGNGRSDTNRSNAFEVWTNGCCRAPTLDISDVSLSPKNLITLEFLQQALANVDKPSIYRHTVLLSVAGSALNQLEGYLTVYSSNQVAVDSLTDLKTLLGDTFKHPVNGVIKASEGANLSPLAYVDESKLYYLTADSESVSSVSLAAVAFSDNVRMI